MEHKTTEKEAPPEYLNVEKQETETTTDELPRGPSAHCSVKAPRMPSREQSGDLDDETNKEKRDLVLEKLRLSIVAISQAGTQLLMRTDSDEKHENLNVFDLRCAPSETIALGDYLSRVDRYIKPPLCVYTAALVYLRRVAKLMTVNDLNQHKLAFVSVMLGSKFLEDVPYKNSYFAKVAGVGVEEMNSIEDSFLELLTWKLWVADEEYSDCNRDLSPIPSSLSIQLPDVHVPHIRIQVSPATPAAAASAVTSGESESESESDVGNDADSEDDGDGEGDGNGKSRVGKTKTKNRSKSKSKSKRSAFSSVTKLAALGHFPFRSRKGEKGEKGDESTAAKRRTHRRHSSGELQLRLRLPKAASMDSESESEVTDADQNVVHSSRSPTIVAPPPHAHLPLLLPDHERMRLKERDQPESSTTSNSTNSLNSLRPQYQFKRRRVANLSTGTETDPDECECECDPSPECAEADEAEIKLAKAKGGNANDSDLTPFLNATFNAMSHAFGLGLTSDSE